MLNCVSYYLLLLFKSLKVNVLVDFISNQVKNDFSSFFWREGSQEIQGVFNLLEQDTLRFLDHYLNAAVLLTINAC